MQLFVLQKLQKRVGNLCGGERRTIGDGRDCLDDPCFKGGYGGLSFGPKKFGPTGAQWGLGT